MSFDPRRDIWGYTPAEINEMDPGELTALYNAREADLAAREKPLKPIEPGSFTEIAFQSELARLQAADEEKNTAAELLAEQLEPLRWVVDGLIPEGLTILAGKPKLGKSWLALLVALGVCIGGTTLGLNTTGGSTLVITLEDGKRRLQERLRRLEADHHPGPLKRLHYAVEWSTLNNGGLDQLEKWTETHPDTRLIVVDTYGRIRGELPDKNRYAEEYNLLGSLQTFATQARVGILLVHHLRKQGADDWLEQLSGTQAFTGAADTLLGLFRERGQMDATLRMVSRDAEEFDLALKFDGARWESMGDAAAYRMTSERTAILEALSELGGEGKVSDIVALVEKSQQSVSKLLVKLNNEGLVKRTRYGVYALTSLSPVVVVTPTPPTTTTTTTTTSTVRGKKICTVCGLVIDPANGDATTHPACDPEW